MAGGAELELASEIGLYVTDKELGHSLDDSNDSDSF